MTRILEAAGGGDAQAAGELLPLVYAELRRLARHWLAGEPAGQTLQPTELVHEAYLRLVGGEEIAWEGRAHFFAACARAMRHLLVDRARRRRTAKHGADLRRVTWDEVRLDAPWPEDAEVVLAVDAALGKLEDLEPRQARIVMLRYFVGMTIEEVAAALNVSPGTVKNEWRFARAWLYREMTQAGTG